jgi:hypothetical protein
METFNNSITTRKVVRGKGQWRPLTTPSLQGKYWIVIGVEVEDD